MRKFILPTLLVLLAVASFGGATKIALSQLFSLPQPSVIVTKTDGSYAQATIGSGITLDQGTTPPTLRATTSLPNQNRDIYDVVGNGPLTLTQTPKVGTYPVVTRNGVTQREGPAPLGDYTFTNATTITFNSTSPLQAGDSVIVLYWY
jgi:hypothetical protein